MSPYRKFDSSSLEKKTLSALSVLLFEQLTGGIYVYSLRDKKILFMNDEFGTLTEIPAPEQLKKGMDHYLALILPEDLEIVNEKIYPSIVATLSSQKKSEFSIFKYSINYSIKTRSGKIKHLFHQTTILEHDLNNSPTVVLSHISDISEYKKDTALLLRISAYDAKKKSWKKIAEEKFLRQPKELSDRETEIMRMIVSGKSQHDTAKALHISYFTVRAHCRHILEKINCKGIKDLKQKCLDEGWA